MAFWQIENPVQVSFLNGLSPQHASVDQSILDQVNPSSFFCLTDHVVLFFFAESDEKLPMASRISGDCVRHIGKYLDFGSLFRLQRTCHHYHEALRDPSTFWNTPFTQCMMNQMLLSFLKTSHPPNDFQPFSHLKSLYFSLLRCRTAESLVFGGLKDYVVTPMYQHLVEANATHLEHLTVADSSADHAGNRICPHMQAEFSSFVRDRSTTFAALKSLKMDVHDAVACCALYQSVALQSPVLQEICFGTRCGWSYGLMWNLVHMEFSGSLIIECNERTTSLVDAMRSVRLMSPPVSRKFRPKSFSLREMPGKNLFNNSQSVSKHVDLHYPTISLLHRK